MTFHIIFLIAGLAIGTLLLSGVLYGLLSRLGFDPLGITGGSVNASEEPLKAAVDLKAERKAQREGDADEH